MTQAYIVIEGMIGVGKTTLARLFQKEIGALLVLEVFEENPFLSDFYTDRARYAFQTQIFFLLSRYHQQRQLATLPRPLISDYMFDKDRLFAQVNLAGDELETYFSVHEALSENVPRPDLVVFLKADTDTLMNRITARDRPYERNMEPAYLDSLRAAYDQFFSTYAAAPVVIIDTNHLDFVRNPDDREMIFSRIRGLLGQGPRQPALPGMEKEEMVIPVHSEPLPPESTAHQLGDLQQFQPGLDRADPYLNLILLQQALGELAGAFARQRIAQADSPSGSVSSGLAAVLAHVIQLANSAGIDLEETYLEKMRQLPQQGEQP